MKKSILVWAFFCLAIPFSMALSGCTGGEEGEPTVEEKQLDDAAAGAADADADAVE